MVDTAAPYREEQLSLLRKHFGFDSLHVEQQTAVDTVLGGKDCSIIAPTGFGKSLCFILPALVFHAVGVRRGVSPPRGTEEGALTVVVSPLLALIADQIAGLKRKNIPCAVISSSQTPKQNREVLDALGGKSKLPFALLYVTAERLTSASFLNVLYRLDKRNRLALFAIDEAHTISQWGHSFRPDYGKLGVLRRTFPSVPVMALTATATPRVARDIVDSLAIPDAVRVQKSFLRSNIRCSVEYLDGSLCKSSVEAHIADYIKDRPGQTGIIYAHKRETVECLVEFLSRRGVKCVGYHGGLTAKLKRSVQESFETGVANVVVATTAFGMGIDKSDVRFVLNHSISSSIENYYQEAGRAGRDGKPSESVIYYSEADANLKRYLASGRGQSDVTATRESSEVALANVESMIQFCTTVKCRRVALLAHFGEKAIAEKVCGADGCDVCANAKDVKIRMRPVFKRSRGGAGRVSGDASRFAGFPGSGFKTASSLVTPSAEFHTARLMSKMTAPVDSIDYPSGGTGAREEDDGNDEDFEVAEEGSGSGFSQKRSIKELVTEEKEMKKAEAQRSSRLSTKGRLRMRLMGNLQSAQTGANRGVRSVGDDIGAFSDSDSERKSKRRR